MFINICIVGVLACAALDLWQRVLLVLFKIPTSNWAVVGRWLISFLRTMIWVQSEVAQRDAMKNELVIGWSFHYLIAIFYAGLYFVFFKFGIIGFNFLDGLIFGVISVIVPWFFFMPAMGAGIMANKMPNPRLACTLAFATHGVFGISLGLLFQIFS